MKKILILGILCLWVSFASAGKIVLPVEETGPMTLNFIQSKFGYKFDFEPLTDKINLAPEYRLDSYAPGIRGYYVVQFPGPIKQEWVDAIHSLGGKTYEYQPRYAFVVSMTDDIKNKVEALDFVRWVGILQPGWKLYPHIEMGTGMKDVIIVLYYEEDGNSIIDQLKGMGAIDILPDFNEWNKSLRCKIPAERILDVVRIPGVSQIEPWLEWELDADRAQFVVQRGVAPCDTARTIWRKGIRGENMIVGDTDDGLQAEHCMFRDPARATYDTLHRKVIFKLGTSTGAHGTATCNLVAGDDTIANGSGPDIRDGVAKKARIYFQTYTSIPSYSQWDMNGWYIGPYNGVGRFKARTHTMSLSRKDTFNIYIYTEMTHDQFSWRNKDFLTCNSMGNYGNNTMGHPPVAKDIISVGGTDNGCNATTIYSSSSRGPTADGRRKPTLVSTTDGGSGIYCAYISTANCVTSYAFGGTSAATPVLAGAMTLMRQYFKEGWYPTGTKRASDSINPSAALLKAVAIAGADPNITGYTVPDNNIGYGRIDLDSSLYFSGDTRRLWLVDNTAGLRTGDSVVYTVNNTSTAMPLRASLVWTDTAGAMRAAIILVNDLNLTAISPTGTIYRGSVYSGGQSTTGGSYDSLNVEEIFRRNVPEVGNWRFIVKARNVPRGPQPYALAVTGALPSVGVEETPLPIVTKAESFELGSAIPNPFNKTTSISFSTPKESHVTLRVYNSLGQLVTTLLDGKVSAGRHKVVWDGKDVVSGIYFYRMEAPGFRDTKKIVVAK